MSRMPENSILCSMNQLSNHDHSRFMTRTNQTVGRIGTSGSAAADAGVSPALYRLGAMMQMTWPGAPTLYYGDEAGMTGWTEPDCRRPYPWGQEDLELIEFHNYLGAMHNRYPVMKRGSLMKLMAGHNYVVYARQYEDEVAIVAVNCGDEAMTLNIPAWVTGLDDEVEIRRLLRTDEIGYNVGITKRHSEDGILVSEMRAHTGKIYYAKKPKLEG